jgi:catechol 2,3-dioxygenase-like lactoylglutathione lyase family enzyme
MASVRPQPLIMVADVPASSRFYQAVLGARSGHGGDEYEMLLVDDELIMQLHAAEVSHHHGVTRDPGAEAGNGVLLWFESDDFDRAVEQIRSLGAELVHDVHVNPNAGHREIWLRDPDGYLVVLAERYEWLERGADDLNSR